LKNPGRDFELNVHNVFLLLEAIRECAPLCRFINLSSAAVYGNPLEKPTTEFHKMAPVSPYGFHKMFAENICSEYFQFYKIQVCSLRIFSAYGVGLKKQIFWDLYLRTRNSLSIELFGTGMEARDFIYIDDIVNAIDCVIENGTFNASVYNLAGGKAWHVKQVAEIFLETIKWKGDLKFSGIHRQGDPDFWQADISRIRDLGFTPAIGLEDGIQKYVKWLSSLE